MLRDKGDYDGMIASLNQAIVINPKNDLAFANRGEGQRVKGDLDQSLKDLDKAVELRPRSPASYTLRGDTLRAKGEFDKAIADYNWANHFVRISSRRSSAGAARCRQKAISGREGGIREGSEDFPSDSDKGRAVPAQAIARENLAAIAQHERQDLERQETPEQHTNARMKH